MTITSYPLCWPAGWKRTPSSKILNAKFSKAQRESSVNGSTWVRRRELTIADGRNRVLEELTRMGIPREDIIISSNIKTRLDGLPRSGASFSVPDAGVAVYWLDIGRSRVIAIDLYKTVADNLAAIAATLNAMRSIERHGGAEILDRAFTGFTALPAPGDQPWREIIGDVKDMDEVREAYRRAAAVTHPDRGGTDEAMARLNKAYAQAKSELRP